MRWRPVIAAVAALAGMTAPAATAAVPPEPAASPAAFAPGRCPLGVDPSLRPRLRCGTVRLPLRYDEPAGRTIRLAVVVVRAARPLHDDPVVLLSGGPGEPLVRHTGDLVGPGRPLTALAARRDLVLLDQRGVGRSRPNLSCDRETSRPTPIVNGDVARLAARVYGACADRLRAAGIRLDAFDTVSNARDLDGLRRALGYARVNLFGTSYGARLADHALRGDPAWIRSAVLASPIPAEANFVVDVGPSFASALNRSLNLCAADPACAAAYPDLRARLQRSLRELAARDADLGGVAALVHRLYYSRAGVQAVPAALDAIAHGRIPAIAFRQGPSDERASVTDGMTLSVVCAEEAAYADRDRIARVARRLPLLPRALVAEDLLLGRPLFAICRRWHVPRADPATFRPVRSSVPALVVTGQLDHITPPRYGRTVAAQLPNARYVEVPGVGHSPVLAGGACALQVVLRFLDDPAAAVRPAPCVGPR